ncbi:hypothetical protein EXN66_Car008422 [Channa argus]|uniref:Uncharacterized protein n=1 Tax=Channa argus TaxID=215402 RepID=A0A6G1PRX2_CHAAH|nr:hypothetical protein EXN66_Car008422 [Channa argus]
MALESSDKIIDIDTAGCTSANLKHTASFCDIMGKSAKISGRELWTSTSLI